MFQKQEAIERIHVDENLDVDSIYIEPLESHVLTDKESVDKEDNGVNRLPGRLPSSPIELDLTNNEKSNA